MYLSIKLVQWVGIFHKDLDSAVSIDGHCTTAGCKRQINYSFVINLPHDTKLLISAMAYSMGK